MKKLKIYANSVMAMLCLQLTANSQSYFYNERYYDSPVLTELGLSIGAMNCLTDLGGRSGTGKKFLSDVNWQNTRFCAGINFSLMYKNLIAIRVEGNYGQVTAADSVLEHNVSVAGYRYLRNLSFRSIVLEAYLGLEFHPLLLVSTFRENGIALSPYILAGIGLYNFNPQAKTGNTWVNLAALHTEGQGFAEYPDKKEYKLTQINLPLGVGLKYELGPIINLRIEMLYRILKTDYLDDVSGSYADPRSFYRNMNPTMARLAETMADRSKELNPLLRNTAGTIRGNPDNKDAYFSFNVKIGFILNRTERY